MKTLNKILAAFALGGIITAGAGLIVKDNAVGYIGASTFFASICGYILTSKPNENKLNYSSSFKPKA
jgi:hypothetical protein